ncbi:MAG: class I SAM-dependent methyltransferase [Halobacteriales archaeon]
MSDEDGHDHGDDTDWAAVYSRQVERDHLTTRWFDRLALDTGDHVLDVGCGPGHLTLLTAQLVGPDGVVYGIDQSSGAVSYLAGEIGDRGIDNVAPILTDGTALGVRFHTPITVLVTFMLHHADTPAAILRSIDESVPLGSRVYIEEYHPDGSADIGPPVDHRIDPDTVEEWADPTELRITDQWDDGDHYSLLFEKA